MHSDRATSAALLDLTTATATATLKWAGDTFGHDLCLLASMQDAVLIDLAIAAIPGVDIVFLDTGYHFPETHQTLRAIEFNYDLHITTIGPIAEPKDQIRTGECCDTKPALLGQALSGRRAWLTGARRCETSERAALDLITHDRRGLTKISPLAQWNDADVARYITANNIITNPLIALGYSSIGCAPCTTKPDPDNPRSGRWRGTTQTECGIHL